MKKEKDYTNQKWNSLSQLKEKIEEDKLEKVKSFDGIKLVTNKYIYGLYDSNLSRRPIDR
jgi:hypothetical protein